MNRQPGAFLIELLVFFAIMIILISLAAGEKNILSAAATRNALDVLYLQCTFLQKTALYDSVTHRVTCHPAHGEYSVDTTSYQLPHGTQFGVRKEAFGPPSDPKKPLRNAITFKNNVLTFHPNGTVDPGTIYLISRTGDLYALTHPVCPSRGFRRYRYDKGKWSAL